MASGNQTLHGSDGDVPDLLVLLLQQQDDAGGLSVEGAGHVQDGISDDALDGIVGDGALGLEAVVGAAGLDQLQEGGGGRVFELRLSGTHCGSIIVESLIYR